MVMGDLAYHARTRCRLQAFRRGWVIRDVRFDLDPGQARPPAEGGELDQDRNADHLGAQFPEEPQGRGDRAAGREEIVHDEHALPVADGVVMDLEGVRAVFQRVFLAVLRAGELARLADRDEPGADRVRQRRADHVAAGLDPDDVVDLQILRAVDEEVDQRLESGRILEQRGDVAEEDARDRKIGDRADEVLDLLRSHGSAGSRPSRRTLVFPATAASGRPRSGVAFAARGKNTR